MVRIPGGVVFCLMLMLTAPLSGHADDVPTLSDERLELNLFAATPEIVTPIGMAIDGQDRIFVIESHTHQRPRDYDGPTSDRIKVFVDNNNDGVPDVTTVFAEGLEQAMNLAFSPDGALYVVCARQVLRLDDTNLDGQCDEQQVILNLETEQRYAHNSLLGITFDRDGWLYVSRGNTGSDAYRLVGSDGSYAAGFGDGGSIARCRADGSWVEEFATGFWNPFDLKFDCQGRLLAVDNDPDARGPNRLLHIVEGGDYGYQSLYGGSGNHPFQGWDGTLPGTLPYIAATGEAPSGIIDVCRTGFPKDYEGSVLSTIWNENSIERFDLDEGAATLVLKKKSVFMNGPKDFRPVALAADSRGNLFVTDWVKVDYPNHGQGRIWRISSKRQQGTLRPKSEFAEYEADALRERFETLKESGDEQDIAEALVTGDAMLRLAARQRLSESRFHELRVSFSTQSDARLRMGALLAEKLAHPHNHEAIDVFLKDRDLTIRRAALMWAGESLDIDLREKLDVAIRQAPVNAILFEAYLAAVSNLDPKFVNAFPSHPKGKASALPRTVDSEFLLRLVKDESLPSEVRGLAVSKLDDAVIQEHQEWFADLIGSRSSDLALAAIRRLNGSGNGLRARFSSELQKLALEVAQLEDVRCEALLVLSTLRIEDPANLLPLLTDQDEDIAIEAARMFRAWIDSGQELECLPELLELELAKPVKERLAEAQRRMLFEDGAKERPITDKRWEFVLLRGGSSKRGRRIFTSQHVGCAKCHTLDGRGGQLGPDLSFVSQSKSRKQIIQSILNPSEEFAPQYQAWTVATTDGKVYRGLQLDHKSGGAIQLTLDSGVNRLFAATDIEDYAASPKSLMPDNLADTMSVEEFKDLVAFLTSLK